MLYLVCVGILSKIYQHINEVCIPTYNLKWYSPGTILVMQYYLDWISFYEPQIQYCRVVWVLKKECFFELRFYSDISNFSFGTIFFLALHALKSPSWVNAVGMQFPKNIFSERPNEMNGRRAKILPFGSIISVHFMSYEPETFLADRIQSLNSRQNS